MNKQILYEGLIIHIGSLFNSVRVALPLRVTSKTERVYNDTIGVPDFARKVGISLDIDWDLAAAMESHDQRSCAVDIIRRRNMDTEGTIEAARIDAELRSSTSSLNSGGQGCATAATRIDIVP